MKTESLFDRIHQKYRENSLWSSLLALSLVSMAAMIILMTIVAWQMYLNVSNERKELIRSQVHSAMTLTQKLYTEAEQGLIAEADAKDRVLSYLNSMEYPGRGYFWVFDPQGVILMHPHHPDLIGTNSINSTDAHGTFHIQAFIKAAKNGGEFTKYYWRHNDEYDVAPKIAYNELFEPWGWVIGSGLYVNDINSSAFEQIAWGITLVFVLFLLNVIIVLKLVSNVMQEFRHTAIRDSLTGLFTRRYLEEIGCRMLDRSEKGAGPLAVIFLDIDHFKSINDNYGHKMGDSVLQTVGSTIKLGLRPNEAAFRYGGEEIIILLYGDEESSQQIAERIREDVARQIYIGERKHFKVTMSAGIAVYKRGEKLAQLLERADRCLYSAKNNGRNCSVTQKSLKD